MIGGQVFRTLARAHDLETRDSRPIDELGNQRRLIAISERVKDTGLGGSPREKRSGQRVRLDIDHHQVPLTLTAGKSVLDSRRGTARRLHDHLEAVRGDERACVVRKERSTSDESFADRLCLRVTLRGSDADESPPSAVEVEVGHPDQVQPRRPQRLRQEHRAELARPDQTDADRFPGPGSLGQPQRHVHRLPASLRHQRSDNLLTQTRAKCKPDLEIQEPYRRGKDYRQSEQKDPGARIVA
jgi:hypothetical protein